LADHISLGKAVLPAKRQLKNYLMMAVGYDSLCGASLPTYVLWFSGGSFDERKILSHSQSL